MFLYLFKCRCDEYDVNTCSEIVCTKQCGVDKFSLSIVDDSTVGMLDSKNASFRCKFET